jgi:hypothetical protein
MGWDGAERRQDEMRYRFAALEGFRVGGWSERQMDYKGVGRSVFHC